jgi:hypothetical protein
MVMLRPEYLFVLAFTALGLWVIVKQRLDFLRECDKTIQDQREWEIQRGIKW